MSFKKTLAALIILAALAGVYYLYEKPRIEREAKEKDTKGHALAVQWDDLEKIAMSAGGIEVVLSKIDGQEDRWEVLQPFQDDADKFAVQGVISKFRTTKPERIIDDPKEDLSSYGLVGSTNHITFTAAGVAETLTFGANHRIGDTIYAISDASPRVYVFSNSLKSVLLEPASKLRDKEIIPSTFDREPVKISFSRKGQVVYTLLKDPPKKQLDDDSDPELNEDKGEWKLVEPTPWWRTDGEAVDKIMQAVRGLRVKTVLSKHVENPDEYGLGESKAIFSISYADGKEPESIDIAIGANTPESDYYAIPPKGYLCLIPEHAVKKIMLSSNDLKDKSLVNFNVPDVLNWVLRFKDKTINVSRPSDGDFGAEGVGPLDQEKILGALRRLVDVEGRRFLSSSELVIAEDALRSYDLRLEMYGADGALVAWIEAAKAKTAQDGPEIVVGKGNVAGGVFEMAPAILEAWPESVDDWLANEPENSGSPE
jgi:Domain of unknown function (DUF4340)